MKRIAIGVALIFSALVATAQQQSYSIPNPTKAYICGGLAPKNSVNCNLIPVMVTGTDTQVGTIWIHEDWSQPGSPSNWVYFGGALAQFNSGNPNNAGDLITNTGCLTWSALTLTSVTPTLYCTHAYAYFATPQYGVNEVTWYMSYFYSSGGGGIGGGGSGVHRVITAGTVSFGFNVPSGLSTESPIAPTPTCYPAKPGDCPPPNLLGN